MSITKLNPHKVLLAADEDIRVIGDYSASATITPGMLVELYNNSGTLQWRAHSSATRIVSLFVAINQPFLNKTIDDTYASGDQMLVAPLEAGDVIYGLVPSGQNITQGDLLQSNGDGKFKADATSGAASSGQARFQALETIGSVNADTRCRIQIIG